MLNISIIIPAYNEGKNIPILLKELSTALDALGKSYEIILIDDGSSDDTYEQIKKNKSRKVRGLSFKKNMGKSTSLRAGFKESRGQLVVTMDSDLQDNPRELVKLIKEINRGFDVVSGWRKERQDTILKKLSSYLFNKFVSLTTGITLHDINCGFKIYKREALDSIKLSGGMHRFMPVLAHWQGYKVAEVIVKHRERKFGQSKYGFGRAMSGFIDLSTILFLNKYAKRPLRFFGVIGVVFFSMGFSAGGYLTFLRFSGEKIGDRPLLVLAVLLMLLGVQFFSLGLLGEMVAAKNKDKLPLVIKICEFPFITYSLKASLVYGV